MSRKPMSTGRIVALDPGSVRVGIAMTDDTRQIAYPHDVVSRHPTHQLIQTLQKLVEERDVALIVVGHPIRGDGKRGKQAHAAEKLADRMRDELKIPVELYDERYSSAEAEEVLIGADVSRRKRKESIDKVAAALILRAYLRESAAT